jgi:hypothetical protein
MRICRRVAWAPSTSRMRSWRTWSVFSRTSSRMRTWGSSVASFWTNSAEGRVKALLPCGQKKTRPWCASLFRASGTARVLSERCASAGAEANRFWPRATVHPLNAEAVICARLRSRGAEAAFIVGSVGRCLSRQRDRLPDTSVAVWVAGEDENLEALGLGGEDTFLAHWVGVTKTSSRMRTWDASMASSCASVKVHSCVSNRASHSLFPFTPN